MLHALVLWKAHGGDVGFAGFFQTVNINLDILRVVGYRQWCNKLWNVIRFAMMYLGTSFEPSLTLDVVSLPLSCKWILSVLNKTVDRTIKGLENFEFSESTTALHSWWLYQLCDVFIELIKPVMHGDDEELKKQTRDTLWVCLDTGLRLLHPFMPFLTEELWQRLPQKPGVVKAKSSIMVADYPTVIQVSWFPAQSFSLYKIYLLVRPSSVSSPADSSA
jgi:valyl-tRNA synthetase